MSDLHLGQSLGFDCLQLGIRHFFGYFGRQAVPRASLSPFFFFFATMSSKGSSLGRALIKERFKGQRTDKSNRGAALVRYPFELIIAHVLGAAGLLIICSTIHPTWTMDSSTHGRLNRLQSR